ncbi:uncharacterized protein LOC123541530 isoform X2 [Mercenaria mercenaria]|nr:uncharacterized protein LOC123541530 isoform X2 [Mercenaria mercenaria]XP_053400453.1 uncharacterized protein LOC123541530 isoform X2 [Mercenaria mercenaria]
MGKGNGDHPPSKFINDQWFFQLFILVFLVCSVTCSSLSIGMDDGGSFPYPYSFTGFVLAPILLVNFISRSYVMTVVHRKGLSKKNLLEILKNTVFGQHIWPWSCKVGMLWCIPGSILSGIGGVNCGIDENPDNNSSTTDAPKVRNTCYYEIEGEHSELYRGLAIGLVIVHVLSFVNLLFSNCPMHSVQEQIKEDPRGNTVSRANNRPAVAYTAAVSTTSAAASDTNNRQASASGGSSNDMKMKTTMQKLEARVRELESRERQMQVVSVLPPPPTYNDSMHPDNCTAAHPDNTFA